MGGLEARGAPAQLQLDAVKPALDQETGSNAAAKWNTKNLASRLGADLISAASAAVLVAPIIAIIDRYALSPSSLPTPSPGP